MGSTSSTVSRVRAVGVLATMLVPLALGLVACGGGGGGDDGGDAGSAGAGAATTVSADTAGAATDSSDSAGGDAGSSGGKNPTLATWCEAFRSLDQDPAGADQESMLAVPAPRDDIEFAWTIVVKDHDTLHTSAQDDAVTQRYGQLKTFADSYCTG
jgi:hypothetical protein